MKGIRLRMKDKIGSPINLNGNTFVTDYTAIAA